MAAIEAPFFGRPGLSEAVENGTLSYHKKSNQKEDDYLRFEHVLKGRDNNLSVIRLVAALLVLYSHAFPLTDTGNDFLWSWTNQQTTLGKFAVFTFSFFSGLFIMKSVEHRGKAKEYFKARCTRVFPPLWIVVLASILILGPVMTTVSIKEYFSDRGTYLYLLNGLLIPVHNLPGVFLNSPYNPTVNGSLWILPVEFFCYVLCYLFYRLGFASDREKTLFSIPLVACTALVIRLFIPYNYILHSSIPPIMAFYIGMLFYLFRKEILISKWLFFASLAVLLAGIIFRVYYITVYISLPYVLMYVCFCTKHQLSKLGSKYEISYGMYLCGFPIQQILTCSIPGGDMPWINFLAAAIFSIGFGFVITWADLKIRAKFFP